MVLTAVVHVAGFLLFLRRIGTEYGLYKRYKYCSSADQYNTATSPAGMYFCGGKPERIRFEDQTQSKDCLVLMY